MAEAHAKLAASSSPKWLSCTGALALEAQIDQPDTGNEFSREGTAAHTVLEKSLKSGNEPVSYLGDLITVDKGKPYETEIEVTQEMIDAVELVIDYVRRLTVKPGFYEQRVDYSHVAPEGFGTSDITLEVYSKIAIDTYLNTLYIVDFKYGLGVKVAAYMNEQLLLYALGALNTLDLIFDREIERVVIVIAQPRLDNIDEFEISIVDLLKWAETVKPKARQAYDLYESVVTGAVKVINPKYFNPTKKGCQWCQGRRLKKCKAYAKTGYEGALDGFEDLTVEQQNDLPAIEVSDNTIKDPAFLDNADLAAIYNSMSMFASFTVDLDTEIASRIKGGQYVPGLKLIATQKPRTWRGDDDAAIKAMRTAGLVQVDYIKFSVISPTEAEKVLEKVKPKSHKRRYRKLEAAAIHRPAGNDKIVEHQNKPVDDEDDLLG